MRLLGMFCPSFKFIIIVPGKGLARSAYCEAIYEINRSINGILVQAYGGNLFIDLCLFFVFMARQTDHFYIRAEVTGAQSGTDIAIDLGAFVDALGKSVLKIHSASITWEDETNPGGVISATANDTHMGHWQLTTQAAADFLTFDDKSVIARGCTAFMNGGNGAAGLVGISEVGDRVDQTWTDGYLVAVEQIFFRALTSSANLSTGDLRCSIILDCTVESLTKDSAMALALSQQ